jgi:hypothetical protein
VSLSVRPTLRSVTVLGALVALVACKGIASGLPDDDASSSEQGGEDGSSSSSPSGSGSSGSGSGSGVVSSSSGAGSSSGTHGGSSSGSGSGGACVPPASTPRVTSNIEFNDAGLPLCGSTACDLHSNVCCVSALAAGSCLAAGSTCPESDNYPQAQFDCLQASDCPCGQVCCGIANDSNSSASAGSNCQDISATGACSPVADAGAQSKSGSAQLCQTDAECKNGMKCSWQVCSVTTPYSATPAMPNLTMCGLQSAAPFNCSEKN